MDHSCLAIFIAQRALEDLQENSKQKKNKFLLTLSLQVKLFVFLSTFFTSTCHITDEYFIFIAFVT